MPIPEQPSQTRRGAHLAVDRQQVRAPFLQRERSLLTNETAQRPINSTPDIGMLRKEVAWVREQENIPFASREREWYQGGWWRNSRFKAVEILRKKLGIYDPESEAHDLVMEEEKVCGTYCCVAGHIAIQYDPDYRGGNANRKGIPVEQVAQEALGVTGDEASRLFSGGNSADRIEVTAQEIAQRVGDQL